MMASHAFRAEHSLEYYYTPEHTYMVQSVRRYDGRYIIPIWHTLCLHGCSLQGPSLSGSYRDSGDVHHQRVCARKFWSSYDARPCRDHLATEFISTRLLNKCVRRVALSGDGYRFHFPQYNRAPSSRSHCSLPPCSWF